MSDSPKPLIRMIQQLEERLSEVEERLNKQPSSKATSSNNTKPKGTKS